MRTYIIMGISIFIILLSLVSYSYGSPLRISTEDANKLIQNGYFKTVLDVRTDPEYSLGHFPGAVHIPAGQIAEKVMNEIPSQSNPILVYCNTGQRARRASELLKKIGYENVRYIAGTYLGLKPRTSL
jgi:rhodanese-related sulfurtransferase